MATNNLYEILSFVEGVYYYRLKVGDAVANGKMLKVK